MRLGGFMQKSFILFLLLVRWIVGVKLIVVSRFEAPVLLVRIEEDVKGSELRRAWRVTEAQHIVSQSQDDVWISEYMVEVSSSARRLYARVEYASMSSALRPLEIAQSSDASYVGARISGGWPLELNETTILRRRKKGKICKLGDSFAGSGRWEETIKQRMEWIPDACQPLRPKAKDAILCLRAFGAERLITIGDSVSRQLSMLIEKRFPVNHIHIKGPLPIQLDSMLHIISRLIRTHSISGPVLLNPAGLWQAAYGNIQDYAYALDTILLHAIDLPHLIVVLTTAVHPIHFLKHFDALTDSPYLLYKNTNDTAQKRTLVASRLYNQNVTEAKRKRSMTLPRVQALVQLEKQYAAKYNRPILDFFHPTLVREDDPLDPNDIRHFGISTLNELRTLLFAFLCNLPTTPAPKLFRRKKPVIAS